MTETQARKQLIAVMRRSLAAGLNTGTAGNASLRTGRGFLITPSGLSYARVVPSDIVAVATDGTARGRRKPSSEWQMHAAIFAARPEFNAVLHAHAPHAAALSTLRKGIPAFHYMVAVAGGVDIRCAPYATFGTKKLAAHAVAALAGRSACLLANHGLIACGAALDDALELAVEVETLARQYLLALSAGKPRILPPVEMARVLKKFTTYKA